MDAGQPGERSGALRDGEPIPQSPAAPSPLRYHPIFDSRTGVLYAIEARLHDERAGAYDHSPAQRPPDSEALTAALDAFANVAGQEERLLLPLNLSAASDVRALLDRTREEMARWALDSARLVFELKAPSAAYDPDQAIVIAAELHMHGYRIAITDQLSCGLQLRLLHEQPPELARIASFLIAGIERDATKRLLLTQRVRLFQSLGVKVLAPGIETDAALRICQDLGCDLVSGAALARAESAIEQLPPSDQHGDKGHKMRRRNDTGAGRVVAQLEKVPALPVDAPMQQVFDWFRQYVEHSHFPVLDKNRRPLGLLLERDIKRFIYSSYGRELLANRALKKTLLDFVTPCPSVDINAPAERILEIYAASDRPPGVLVTKDWAYHGFLSQAALLQIIEQEKLATAREQNPLTGLPGNRQILEYIGNAVESANSDRALVYFDFDHFKPFNDRYGFRHGDRVIQLFGELLCKSLPASTGFAGHIGGDDFFAGFRQIEEAEVIKIVTQLLYDFAQGAESLYDPEDRERGYIEAPSRADLGTRRLPLLRCSAALMMIPAGVGKHDQVETVTRRMAALKKTAKASPGGLATFTVNVSDLGFSRQE